MITPEIIFVRQPKLLSRAAPKTLALQYIGGCLWAVDEWGNSRLLTNLAQDSTGDFIVITAQTTLTSANSIVLCNGTFSVFLPSVAANIGVSFTIKNVGAGTITLDGADSELIEGATTATISTGVSLTVISDGNNWWII